MTWPLGDYSGAALPARGRRARANALLSSVQRGLPALELYSVLPLTNGTGARTLAPALQDLAEMVVWDLHEACGVLDDPGLWYPGVDEGIEPVTDDHVKAVAEAVQPELHRELRARYGLRREDRPAVVVADLPWRIQRAFAERRRLRYQEWGITRAGWEANRWRLEDVPDDDWSPPWL